MQSSTSRMRRNYRAFKGISVVEFVGCLAALGGGIVLGSMYLGVDVKAMAVGVLEKADINVPAVLSEGTSEGSETTQPTDSQAELSYDGGELSEGTGLVTEEENEQTVDAADDSVGSENAPAPEPLTEAEKKIATKECWMALSAAVREESSNRSKSVRDPGDWQLFDYLLHRKEGHAKAVEAIEAIEMHGVDQRLNAHVQQFLAWHRSGAELFERAAHLLTDAPAGKLSGPFAQSWQSASTQHRMEEKLILNKHKAVASYLEHTHKSSSEPSDSF